MKGCAAVVGGGLLICALFAVWLTLPQTDPALYATQSRGLLAAIIGVFVLSAVLICAEKGGI